MLWLRDMHRGMLWNMHRDMLWNMLWDMLWNMLWNVHWDMLRLLMVLRLVNLMFRLVVHRHRSWSVSKVDYRVNFDGFPGWRRMAEVVPFSVVVHVKLSVGLMILQVAVIETSGEGLGPSFGSGD